MNVCARDQCSFRTESATPKKCVCWLFNVRRIPGADCVAMGCRALRLRFILCMYMFAFHIILSTSMCGYITKIHPHKVHDCVVKICMVFGVYKAWHMTGCWFEFSLYNNKNIIRALFRAVVLVKKKYLEVFFYGVKLNRYEKLINYVATRP